MDRRETAFDPFRGSFNEKTMQATLTDYALDVEVSIRCEYEVCDVCDGRGTHVNPAIDAQGLTRADFDEDPDFEEAYFAGAYDVACARCDGRRVIPVPAPGERRDLWEIEISEHRAMRAEMEAERRAGA
jgi:hypothetical protein